MPRRQRAVAQVTAVTALTGEFNPFEYYFASGYAGSNDVQYDNFCTNYISYKPFNSNNCYKFVFNTKETYHCGYCSDNDGTTRTSLRKNDEEIYVNIPDELTIEQCTALFQPINNIATCYCCINNNKYYIASYSRV
jgi:hypothetical protein